VRTGSGGRFGGEDGEESTIAGDKLRLRGGGEGGGGGTRTALRAFKPGVKPGFISDLFTPGKQLTRSPTIPSPVSSVYCKQPGRDSFDLTNDPGMADHSRKKQFIPAKWTHLMSLWFKARDRRASRDEQGLSTVADVRTFYGRNVGDIAMRHSCRINL